MTRVLLAILGGFVFLAIMLSLDTALWFPFLVAGGVVAVLASAGAVMEGWKLHYRAKRDEYDRTVQELRIFWSLTNEMRRITEEFTRAVARLSEAHAASQPAPMVLQYDSADLEFPAGAQAVADPGYRRVRRRIRRR